MAQFIYRLQLLLEQREERRKEAERELLRQEKELETQSAALQSLQQKVDQLVGRRRQLQREVTKTGDAGVLSAKDVQQRFEETQVVGLLIDDAKNAALTQRSLIEQCAARVQEAKKNLQEATREVEVLQKHRAKQEERFQRELQAQEELVLDEIGNVLHTTRRQQL